MFSPLGVPASRSPEPARCRGVAAWTVIPRGTRARRIATIHGAGNGVVLVLFTISWFLRLGNPNWEPGGAALTVGFVGVVIAVVTGWLGGELVDRLGVGVADGANVDAPNSLSGKPASARL